MGAAINEEVATLVQLLHVCSVAGAQALQGLLGRFGSLSP